MIAQSDWNDKHAEKWLATYQHFLDAGQPYYFDDWRGYARACKDNTARAKEWVGNFMARLLDAPPAKKRKK